MMTKEQHIAYWVDTAGDDWRRKELIFDAKDYTCEQLEKLKEVRQCLLAMLQ